MGMRPHSASTILAEGAVMGDAENGLEEDEAEDEEANDRVSMLVVQLLSRSAYGLRRVKLVYRIREKMCLQVFVARIPA